MFIIKIEANANGSRPPMQSWSKTTAPEGFALATDAQKDVFYSTIPAGFVNITVKEENGVKIVDTIEVNQVALDAYKATLPDPTDSIKAEKIAEIKKDCEDYIYAGTSVTYADGTTEHFTYTLADQSNISEMFNQTTQKALSSSIINLLMQNDTFLNMQESVKRISSRE